MTSIVIKRYVGCLKSYYLLKVEALNWELVSPGAAMPVAILEEHQLTFQNSPIITIEALA